MSHTGALARGEPVAGRRSPQRGRATRGLGWLLTGGALLYNAALIALVAAWSVAPYSRWWIGVSNLLAPLCFLPLAALIPLALVVRTRWMVGAALVPLAIFLALFGDRFVPRRPALDGGQPLRVVTLNVWRENRAPERTVEIIRAQRADVVALQELTPDVAARLVSELRDDYPYRQVTDTLALLSRHPIVESGSFANVRSQWATLDLGGRSVAVINVHLYRSGVGTGRSARIPWLPTLYGYESRTQREQLRLLLGELERARLPYVLLGDFNLSDRDPAYAELSSRLTDAYRTTESGFGYTYPSSRRVGPVTLPFPLLRIDYIWTTPEIAPSAAEVRCDAGSDHCMLVADLQLAR